MNDHRPNEPIPSSKVFEPVDFRALAALEERREWRGVSEVADEFVPFAGGMVGRGPAGAWFNGARGAGMSGPVSRDEVRGFIEYLEGAGIEPRIDVCPFVDPSLLEALKAERFALHNFESVFHRRLEAGERVDSPFPAPRELRIAAVDPKNDAEVEDFARTALQGFMPDDTDPPESFLRSSMRVARHPRTVAIRAMIGEECVGAGAMEVDGELAALFGVSVRKAHRNKGVQLAMLAWRLNEAARRGARIATIGSRPGVATERNAQRMGFAAAYTKVTLVRPGPGLAPNVD
ncbi:MAG: hypothetical protein IBJ10_06110 [Phycisphaerales bacterium]|nr:hypothetical protein [Phycisphaerales bacterium]